MAYVMGAKGANPPTPTGRVLQDAAGDDLNISLQLVMLRWLLRVCADADRRGEDPPQQVVHVGNAVIGCIDNARRLDCRENLLICR